MSLLDLATASNWDVVYTDSLQVTPGNGIGSYIPIPKFKLPIILEKRILGIKVTSTDAKPSWFLGCKATQIISTFGFASTDIYGIQKKCRLNAVTLAVFPELASTYSLLLEIPYWLKDVSLTIAEYQGTEGELLDQQDRIEGKLDTFLSL